MPPWTEVFLVFLRLGCASFGGPIAHLGYFEKEIVERRQWCSQGTFAELIALAQSLPGPSSSQVGFALGVIRTGWLGGVAAWVGFTLPSAVLMLAFASGRQFLSGATGTHVLHGLQLVAVAVVAQAVSTMQRSLAPDKARTSVAVAATGLTLFLAPDVSTPAAIVLGACLGMLLYRSEIPKTANRLEVQLPKAPGIAAGVLFVLLPVLLGPLTKLLSLPGLDVFAAFYRSGALVFGGGHVVLPLLQGSVVARGWIELPTFLAGYSAAQALPGPLFTFAAFLGASVRPSANPLVYGLLGLAGIFLPGLLAMTAVLPFWSAVRGNRTVTAALTGINASVVGILIAALFNPLWITTIRTAVDFWIALLIFVLLTLGKLPPWIVVSATILSYPLLTVLNL